MARAAVVAVALMSLALSACEREQKGISEDLPAARAARARADTQQIAGALRLYQATFGSLPDTLDALTQAQTAGGVTGGPFLTRVPAPPAGWSAYQYAKQGEVNFTVTSSGGGVTVTAP